MKIEQFMELLGAEYVTEQIDNEREYTCAFASDLMSDVLALADNTTVLITGLNNPQVIRTAEMLDISLIILVRGKKPSEESLNIANEAGITILATDMIMFETCGKLYKFGLSPLLIR